MIVTSAHRYYCSDCELLCFLEVQVLDIFLEDPLVPLRLLEIDQNITLLVNPYDTPNVPRLELHLHLGVGGESLKHRHSGSGLGLHSLG